MQSHTWSDVLTNTRAKNGSIQSFKLTWKATLCFVVNNTSNRIFCNRLGVDVLNIANILGYWVSVKMLKNAVLLKKRRHGKHNNWKKTAESINWCEKSPPVALTWQVIPERSTDLNCNLSFNPFHCIQLSTMDWCCNSTSDHLARLQRSARPSQITANKKTPPKKMAHVEDNNEQHLIVPVYRKALLYFETQLLCS